MGVFLKAFIGSKVLVLSSLMLAGSRVSDTAGCTLLGTAPYSLWDQSQCCLCSCGFHSSLHPFCHLWELAFYCLRHRYRWWPYCDATMKGSPGLSKRKDTDFCIHTIHCWVLGRKQLFKFVARQCNTMGTVDAIPGLTKKACDSGLSRTTVDKRKQHHGLVLLQAMLLRSCDIDVCKSRGHVL